MDKVRIIERRHVNEVISATMQVNEDIITVKEDEDK